MRRAWGRSRAYDGPTSSAMRSFCSSQSSLGFRLKQPSEPYDGSGTSFECHHIYPQKRSTTSTLSKSVGSNLAATEETLVRQPVRVLDDGKQTGRRANARHGPKWMEEADITLYVEQRPPGDLSQSKSRTYFRKDLQGSKSCFKSTVFTSQSYYTP